MLIDNRKAVIVHDDVANRPKSGHVSPALRNKNPATAYAIAG
jgi:hypothetical protein